MRRKGREETERSKNISKINFKGIKREKIRRTLAHSSHAELIG
jgi:hypothetical protein